MAMSMSENFTHKIRKDYDMTNNNKVNINVPANIHADWVEIADRLKMGMGTVIREALLDLAQEDEHHNDIADFKHKGKIGVRRPRDPIIKATKAEGRVTITIPFTPEEAKTVTEFLNRSNVPLSMPEALAILRLYFLGMADEAHARYMMG